MNVTGDLISILKYPQKKNPITSSIQKEVKKGQDIKSKQFEEIKGGKHVFPRAKTQKSSRRYE